MRTIDLNCDLGERDEAIRDGTDEALMEIVSSASIACGGHAGDEATMEASIAAALRHGTAIGAHPGYPDRERFGRVALRAAPEEIERFVEQQVRALAGIASRLGAALHHVKPHGALYHEAMSDPVIAEAIARAVLRIDRDLSLLGLAGSSTLELWRGMGLRVASEAFADRRYERDGTLRSRDHDDALITYPTDAAEQAVRIARGEGVLSRDSTVVAIRADSLCVHGDTQGAPVIAREVRTYLESAGFRIDPFQPLNPESLPRVLPVGADPGYNTTMADEGKGIVVLERRIEPAELARLVAMYFGDMVKFVADVERGVIAIGGELHADAEQLLLESGSHQTDLWGANYYPGLGRDDCIEYTALINIRPAQGNRSMEIQEPALRERVRALTFDLIGEGEALS